MVFWFACVFVTLAGRAGPFAPYSHANRPVANYRFDSSPMSNMLSVVHHRAVAPAPSMA